MSDERLLHLAEAAGLSIDWVDANERPQRVTPDVLRSVLAGLGLPAQTAGDIDASLEKLNLNKGQESLPPLLTLDQGSRLALSAYFKAGQPFSLEPQESGQRTEGHLDAQAQLPAIDIPGYYRLHIDTHEVTLAVAPPACPEVTGRNGAAWGLTVQLYGLRRPDDGGLGDTQALEELIRHAAAHGADAVSISPVHAMFNAYPQQYSPYSPSSRLFFNILHSAPGSILGERALRQAIESTGLAEELDRLEQLELLDWPAVTKARQHLLRELFNEFRTGGNPQQQDFDSFREAGGQALEHHCRFEALHAALAGPQGHACHWREWPEQYQDPHSAAVQTFAAEHTEEIGFYAFCQWLIARGLERAQITARSAGMTIGLIADLAVGADGGGSQAWSRQAELLASLSVGAPPDILNQHGQNWGISAFSPNGLRDNGFRAFIEMLRANLAHAGGIRIDHIMGLKRLWVMPQGADPNHGAYLNYPFEDMLRLLNLEAWRHAAIILGEDLGTIPDGLRDKLAARNIFGMRVMLFEGDSEGHLPPPDNWSPGALATTATHDIPTIAGWWQGYDIDWRIRVGQEPAAQREEAVARREQERMAINTSLRRELQQDESLLLTPEQALDASATFLGRTAAPLVLFPLEDTLGLIEQANMPGNTAPHPNWGRRYPGDSATLLDGLVPAKRLALLADARRQASRRKPQ